ncbi:MAG TPA: DUF58 domain-containing protein [Allosphingosinicella sp.]|nr:DUF58 domain-containing protein [Allosphingosinicella sp.]
MIYPTRTLILLAAATAPVAFVVAVAAPAYWQMGLVLLVVLLALALVDALVGPTPGELAFAAEAPQAVSVGETFGLTVAVSTRTAARRVETAAELEGPLEAAGPLRARMGAVVGGTGIAATLDIRAERRGTGRIASVWLRLPGLIGLVWKQRRVTLDREVLITPDIRPTHREGIALASRELLHGQIARRETGEGAEFDALADFRPGMDRRAIDWKQSARHTRLIAKEYQVERNNHIILAIDSGRTMSEPMEGVPRIDSAVSAALLTAFVALKQGDRIGLFAFDAKPRASSKVVSGPGAFNLLQRVAAGIDYSENETNYTLALATLASALKRRALVIVFTEFTDTVSAELMLAALGPLIGRHLLLFVVLRDAELEGFTSAEPGDPDDISRAVTAAGLLQERRLVLTRLKHLGVEVVEAPAAEAGPAVVNAYLDLKRRGRL